MKTIKEAETPNETEQAVIDFLEASNIQYTTQAAGKGLKTDDGWEHDKWACIFTKQAVSVNFEYSTGIGHRAYRVKPEKGLSSHCLAYRDWTEQNVVPVAPFAAGVIWSIMMDSEALETNFQDWACEFGYDHDSIKALQIYNACCDNGRKLKKVFSREQIEQLFELVQDY